MARTITANGMAISALRRSRGFSSREALAREIDKLRLEPVSVGTIKNAELGRNVFPGNLLAIARALGLGSMDPLVAGAGYESSAGPFTMFECQQDFLRWQSGQKAGKLIVKTIALELTNGWENIAAAVNEAVADEIEFQILVLTHRPERIKGDAPPVVRAWSRHVGSNLKLLRDGLAQYSGQKHVSLQVKPYVEVPTLHGMRAEASATRHYVTRCKWTKKAVTNLEWGEGDYRIVPAECANTELLRLRKEFDARFDQLWSSSHKPVMKQTIGINRRSMKPGAK